MHPAKIDFKLYVITEEVPELNRGHLDVAGEAVAGGATAIQLRDKTKPSREMVDIARRMSEICRESGAALIINDRPDIALAAGADGVHLGRDDMSYEDAWRILPPLMIIGVSATNYREALEADRNGADYIGVGPVFETPSKEDAGVPLGTDVLSRICREVNAPVVAIGGINMDNVGKVKDCGVSGIAVISAVTRSADMKASTKKLARVFDERPDTRS